jgi:hypothetical protein
MLSTSLITENRGSNCTRANISDTRSLYSQLFVRNLNEMHFAFFNLHDKHDYCGKYKKQKTNKQATYVGCLVLFGCQNFVMNHSHKCLIVSGGS